MSSGPTELDAALEREDPIALAGATSRDELERLIAAESLLEKRHARKQRSARAFTFAQAMVGYVALAGFFANAYQNYINKKQTDARAVADEKRWAQEFKRAQDADKYRAFFETSALATDPTNPDKRLVGYALLKEFVSDELYNSKATFMLEESLAFELRSERGPGLDEPHRAAVMAILSALSHTTDCAALARASRTIGKLAAKHQQGHDLAESQEVLSIYVLRIIGRAAEICPPKDLLDVRRPIRDFMLRQPDVAVLGARPTGADVDHRIAEILQSRCQEEIAGGIPDCAEVPAAWVKMCARLAHEKVVDGLGLCQPSAGGVPARPQ
jgi:hypothetical protein